MVEYVVARGRWCIIDDTLHFAWGGHRPQGTCGSISPIGGNNMWLQFEVKDVSRWILDAQHFVASMYQIKLMVDAKPSREAVIKWFTSRSAGQTTSDYTRDAGYYCLHGQYH